MMNRYFKHWVGHGCANLMRWVPYAFRKQYLMPQRSTQSQYQNFVDATIIAIWELSTGTQNNMRARNSPRWFGGNCSSVCHIGRTSGG